MISLPGFRGLLLRDVPLAPLTTWRVGGPAEILAVPDDLDDLFCLLDLARRQALPVYVLGRGSNVLIDDAGLPGITVRLGEGFCTIAAEEGRLRAGAGVPLPKLAVVTAQSGVAGFEHLVGIPGTVGAGVVINAGAGGHDMRGLLRRVTYLDDCLQLVTLDASGLDLAYRHSRLQDSPAIVLEAIFDLDRRAAPGTIRAEMRRILADRRLKLPLDLPNAGSVFKRPGAHFPGQLIESAGLKGARVGDAQVSEVHANFIVNLGRATARDIRSLVELVQTRVHEVNGIELEREIVYLPEQRNR